MTMRAVIYARVSSDMQREKQTISSQLTELPAYIERQGWELVRPADTYIDDGITAATGSVDKRPGLQRLLADAVAGHFDVVAVVGMSRLTRADFTERSLVLGAFQRAGVKIAETSTGLVLDLAESQGDLMGSLRAFFAAEERRTLVERLSRGKREAARRGRKPGGPTPYGLTYDRATGQIGINEAHAKVIREIYRLVSAGQGSVTIAYGLNVRGVPPPSVGDRRTLGEWQRHHIPRIVRSKVYRGVWRIHRKERIEIAVPAIVDDELWYAAQATLDARVVIGRRPTKWHYLCKSLAYCGLCHNRLLCKSSESGHLYYICARRLRPRFGQEPCNLRWLNARVMDTALWSAIAELLETRWDELAAAAARHLAADEAGAKDWASDIEAYAAHNEQLKKAKAKFLASYQRGLLKDDELDAGLEKLTAEQRFVERQLRVAKRAQRAAQRSSPTMTALEQLDALRARLTDLDKAGQREIIRQLIPGGDYCIYMSPDLKIEANAVLGAADSAASGGSPDGQGSNHRPRQPVITLKPAILLL